MRLPHRDLRTNHRLEVDLARTFASFVPYLTTSVYPSGGDEHTQAQDAADDWHMQAFRDDRVLRAIYLYQVKKNQLKQRAFGLGFFLVFLVYPSITNKIFAFFYCFVLDNETSFLMADYSVSCEDPLYYLHYAICVGGVGAIPLGVPCLMGFLIWRQRADIKEGHGPHELKDLYSAYKPECCMWEVYQMSVPLCDMSSDLCEMSTKCVCQISACE